MTAGAAAWGAALVIVSAAIAVARRPDLAGSIDLSAVSAAADTGAAWVAAVLSFSLGRMRSVSASMLSDPNVRAFLRVIRVAEGTADDDGYRRIFGGQLFASFEDHPRVAVRWSGGVTTAAGAYQFLASTWDETAAIMGLRDFSPASQDLAALGRVAARGALDAVRAGQFEEAVKACALEWASLPGSPYGQPTISMDRARALFASAGGTERAMA